MRSLILQKALERIAKWNQVDMIWTGDPESADVCGNDRDGGNNQQVASQDSAEHFSSGGKHKNQRSEVSESEVGDQRSRIRRQSSRSVLRSLVFSFETLLCSLTADFCPLP